VARKASRQDSRRGLADALREARQKERRRKRSLRSQDSADASSDDDRRGGLSPGRQAQECSSSEDESGGGRPLALARKPKGSVQEMSSLFPPPAFSIQCFERPFPGRNERPPVKLVVFDFDETLTIATFMADSCVSTGDPAKREKFMKYNFESPWARGDRVAKLRCMLERLSQSRVLAVLSRNSAGAEPVLDLLRIAGLDVFFAAVWVMPWFPGRDNGAFRANGGWKCFSPPLEAVEDHKADVLHLLVRRPAAFFPQLGGEGASESDLLSELCNLRLEEVVLVDDNGANFESETGLQVLRYAKVARYNAPYRAMGTLHDIGGIGARDGSDYDTLVRFVTSPWEFPLGDRQS